jgi:hypothetical protein
MSNDEHSEQPVAKGDSSDRILGVVALVGAGVIGYLCVVAPLLAASRHEGSVDLSLKGVVALPPIFATGIINLIMGERPRPILGRRQMPSPLGFIIYGVTFVIGILLYQWLKSRLREYGYGV